MANGKYSKNGRSTKVFALMLAMVLLIGCAIGGTVAWLMDTSKEVKNTFTTSDISIELNETEREYKMIPGWTIPKDPKVTVTADSEDCYVFVKITENLGAWSDNKVGDRNPEFTDYLDYTVANGWTAGQGTGEGKNGVPVDVYYRTVDVSATTGPLYVLQGEGEAENKNGYVTVKDIVTKEMMDEIKTDSDKPTLTFTAYAVQLYRNNTQTFTPAEAWEKIGN